MSRDDEPEPAVDQLPDEPEGGWAAPYRPARAWDCPRCKTNQVIRFLKGQVQEVHCISCAATVRVG